MIHIICLRRTCIACPSQWEGISNDGRTVLIHYRGGFLSVSYMTPSESQYCRYDLERIFEKELFAADFVYGEEFSDGFIEDFTTVRMILTKEDIATFPENIEIVDEEWRKS
jgi:hypothetical protein